MYSMIKNCASYISRYLFQDCKKIVLCNLFLSSPCFKWLNITSDLCSLWERPVRSQRHTHRWRTLECPHRWSEPYTDWPWHYTHWCCRCNLHPPSLGDTPDSPRSHYMWCWNSCSYRSACSPCPRSRWSTLKATTELAKEAGFLTSKTIPLTCVLFLMMKCSFMPQECPSHSTICMRALLATGCLKGIFVPENALCSSCKKPRTYLGKIFGHSAAGSHLDIHSHSCLLCWCTPTEENTCWGPAMSTRLCLEMRYRTEDYQWCGKVRESKINACFNSDATDSVIFKSNLR